MTDNNNNQSYSQGHPWHYVLGGKVPSIKEIWKDVHSTGYKGYLREEISKARGNSPKLRAIKQDVLNSLKVNISRYRQCALELHRFRSTTAKEKEEPDCDNVHVSISLKRNHIYNDLAHLTYIDDLLSHQPELFDLM